MHFCVRGLQCDWAETIISIYSSSFVIW